MSDAKTPDRGAQMPDDRALAARAQEGAAKLREYRARHGLPSPKPLPEKIGRYRITRWIGAGGMGEVYEAEQSETGQNVALKIVRGPASAEAQKLFEYEKRLQGRLHHPAVGRIFDAGHTEDGQPYFVMELIEGQSITEYCRLADLSLRDRLALFRAVCDAVQYLHDRGVIHRDLKPANILVDEDGKPCVLDFGLARYTDPNTEETRPHIEGGDLIGSLCYMSPEQTREDPADLDIRTDVYSLGVVLYEILTGGYPYSIEDSLDGTLRNIREAPPDRPSSIDRDLDDDVDTIVLKALEKDRDDRYESARALGADIQHYLTGEPIDAKRDRRSYVLKKWAIRNASWLAPTIIVVALLATLLVQAQLASLRERADWRKNKLLQAQLVVAQEPDEDDYEASKLDPDAKSTRKPPGTGFGTQYGPAGAVDVLSKALDQDLEFLEALILRGSYYYDLGRFDKARIDAERAQALHPRAADACYSLGRLFFKLKMNEDAVAALERAVELRDDSAKSWHTLGQLLIRLAESEHAVAALERAVELRDDYAEAWYDLGRAFVLQEEPDRALEAYAKATSHPLSATRAWDGIGRVHYNRGKYLQARDAFRNAAESDDTYWRAFRYLALCHQILVEDGDALRAYGRLLELQPEHVEGLNNAAWIQLTSASQGLRDYEMALQRASRAVKAHPGHREFLETLALAELRTGNNVAARDRATQALHLGKDSAWIFAVLAYAELELGNVEAARENRDRVTAGQGRVDGSFLSDLDARLLAIPAGGDPHGEQESEEKR